MDKFYVKELLKNLCCSDCGADFCRSAGVGGEAAARTFNGKNQGADFCLSAGVGSETAARTFNGKNQGADFDHFKVLRQEGNLFVINLICPRCRKDFGTCILSMCDSPKGDVLALELQDGPDLITVDEVIDANLLIKDLKSDWSKQIFKP